MARRLRKQSITRIIGCLVVVSAAAAVLPVPLTDGLSSMLQVLVPLQHGISALTPGPEPSGVQLSGEEAERLHRTLRGFENRFAAMSLRIDELERDNRELSGVRGHGLQGGRLISARIVAADSLPWRDSRLLERGTLAGIGPASTVVSNHYVLSGEQDGALDGMSILSAEALVGEIVRANTHTASVLLVTDPAARPRLVRIGRQTPAGFSFVPDEFMIHGVGDSHMEVRGVSHSYVDQGQIAEHDVVLTSAADEHLPISILIGHVASAPRRDDDNGVLYNLTVEPAVDMAKLKRVYVVSRPAVTPDRPVSGR